MIRHARLFGMLRDPVCVTCAEELDKERVEWGNKGVAEGLGLTCLCATVREDDILCLLESEREARRLR